MRIRIAAEVDGVCRQYEMTYDKDNVVVGYAYAKADAPVGGEADAGLAVVVKAFTDEKPKAQCRNDDIVMYRMWWETSRQLMRCAELADVMEKRLEEASRQSPHPCLVEVYVAVDGSEACLSFNQLWTYCARNGAVRETKLEPAFSRYEEEIRRTTD